QHETRTKRAFPQNPWTPNRNRSNSAAPRRDTTPKVPSHRHFWPHALRRQIVIEESGARRTLKGENGSAAGRESADGDGTGDSAPDRRNASRLGPRGHR